MPVSNTFFTSVVATASAVLWDGRNHTESMLVRRACSDPKGRYAPLFAIADCNELSLVSSGLNLLGQVISVAPLNPQEQGDLAWLSRMTRGKQRKHLERTGEDLESRENQYLARCPRVTATGYDVDTLPGLPHELAMAASWDLMQRIGAAEAQEGAVLRWSYSGGPGKPRLHGEWGPCPPDAADPDLLAILHRRVVRLCRAHGIPTSADLPSALDRATEAVDRQGLGEVGKVEFRRGALAVTQQDFQPPDLVARALSIARVTLPSAWVDLVPLNHKPASRGRLWRPLGGLHKRKDARKSLVDPTAPPATPIDPTMLDQDRLAPTQDPGVASPSACDHPRAQNARPKAPPSFLTSEAEDSADAWAMAHAPAYGALPSGRYARHDLALAIGGYVGRHGLPSNLARRLAAGLAGAGGDAEATDRGRVAEDSARNASSGRRTYGLPTLERLLGPSAAVDLRNLVSSLRGEVDGGSQVPAGRPGVEPDASGRSLPSTGATSGALCRRGSPPHWDYFRHHLLRHSIDHAAQRADETDGAIRDLEILQRQYMTVGHAETEARCRYQDIARKGRRASVRAIEQASADLVAAGNRLDEIAAATRESQRALQGTAKANKWLMAVAVCGQYSHLLVFRCGAETSNGRLPCDHPYCSPCMARVAWRAACHAAETWPARVMHLTSAMDGHEAGELRLPASASIKRFRRRWNRRYASCPSPRAVVTPDGLEVFAGVDEELMPLLEADGVSAAVLERDEAVDRYHEAMLLESSRFAESVEGDLDRVAKLEAEGADRETLLHEAVQCWADLLVDRRRVIRHAVQGGPCALPSGRDKRVLRAAKREVAKPRCPKHGSVCPPTHRALRDTRTGETLAMGTNGFWRPLGKGPTSSKADQV